MRKPWLALWLGVAGTWVGAQHTAPLHAQAVAPRVDVVAREADRRVDVTVDSKPFTSYIWPTTLKKPTLYPLRAASGVVVTRGWPLDPRPGERVDHPHQVGLWFDHGDVNGLAFWNNSDAVPGARADKMGTSVRRAVRGAKSSRSEGTLDVTAEWVNSQAKPLLREDTRFVFRAAEGLRTIDRITTLTALDALVTFTDNKEGLIGLRVARALEQPANTPEVFTDAAGHATTVPVLNNEGVTGHYHSSEGLEGDSVWGTRGRWTMLTGVVQGEPVTLAILDHPTNVGFPTYWHARGYGLFAANPLGQKVFTNGKGELNFKLAPGQAAGTYGFPSGAATAPSACGAWVQSHNLKTCLEGVLEYSYEPISRQRSPSPEGRGGQGVRPTFMGYRRPNGRVGTRNEVWILNTVGCVNHAAERIAREGAARFQGRIDGVYSFSHPYGCGQLGDDLRNTQRTLSGLLRHPNAGGVLVLGLGCENNQMDALLELAGSVDRDRLRCFKSPDVTDEA